MPKEPVGRPTVPAVVVARRESLRSATSTATTDQPEAYSSGNMPPPDAPRGPKAYNTTNRRSGGYAHPLTSGLAAVRAPSNAAKGPRPKSAMSIRGLQSRAASQMNNMQLNGSQQQDWQRNNVTYNPSLGPTQSTMTTPWRNDTVTRSQASSAQSRRAPYASPVCRLSNYTRNSFRLGDVISMPFHRANTNPDVDPNDRCLAHTCVGPVYSKRRMMIVLFIYTQDMYCLPLYSFGDRGLRAKPEHLRSEYVCVANEGDEQFVNQSPHKFVRVTAKRPLDNSTTIQLTGGLRVECNEDIAVVGRMTRQTYFDLVELWASLVRNARKEPWR